MKPNATMLLIGAASIGALLYYAQGASAATNFKISAGHTYKISIKAVGTQAKISDQDIQDNVKILQALGATVSSASANDARDTLTIVMTAARDSTIPLNKFIPSPLIPNAGLMFTSAAEVTSPAQGMTGMGNPASENCVARGGKSQIVTNPDGSQSGYCVFPDGKRYEEWALFRGEVGPDK